MRQLPLIALCLLASPAMAETGYSCVFTVACEAAGSCEPAAIEIEIGIGEDGILAFLETDAAPVPALSLSDADSSPFTIATTVPGAGSDLITIHADGTALRSRHPANPGSLAITYFGICEET